MKAEQPLQRSNTLKKMVTGIVALLQAILKACGKKKKEDTKKNTEKATKEV